MNRGYGHLHPHAATVFAKEAQLEGETGTVPGNEVPVRFDGLPQVVRVREPGNVHGLQLVGCKVHQLLERCVAVKQPPARIHPHDADRCVIKHRAMQVLAGLQGIFGPLATGHVAADADHDAVAVPHSAGDNGLDGNQHAGLANQWDRAGGLAAGKHFPNDERDFLEPLGRVKFGDGLADHLGEIVAKAAKRDLVGVDDATCVVEHEEHVFEGIEEGLEVGLGLAHGFFGAHAIDDGADARSESDDGILNRSGELKVYVGCDVEKGDGLAFVAHGDDSQGTKTLAFEHGIPGDVDLHVAREDDATFAHESGSGIGSGKHRGVGDELGTETAMNHKVQTTGRWVDKVHATAVHAFHEKNGVHDRGQRAGEPLCVAQSNGKVTLDAKEILEAADGLDVVERDGGPTDKPRSVEPWARADADAAPRAVPGAAFNLHLNVHASRKTATNLL